jgi:uncharacterized HAD superfamily protein
MNFRSVNDLNKLIIKNLWKIPHDIDVVVGIPRSGLFVANLISLYLNLPLSDVDRIIKNQIISNGKRKINSFKKINKILLVDDSIQTGRSMKKSYDLIKLNNADLEILTLTAYLKPLSPYKADIALEYCSRPRYFEWNLMHRNILEKSCCDLDGVLTRDPTKKENDGSKKYKEFLNKSEPLFVPTYKIKTIVTCRLEKYRKMTEDWLEKNRIKYDELIMMNYNTNRERKMANNYSKFKANVYKAHKYKLFIESSLKQSKEIAYYSNKIVYCLETGSFIEPKELKFKIKTKIRQIFKKVYFFLEDFAILIYYKFKNDKIP